MSHSSFIREIDCVNATCWSLFDNDDPGHKMFYLAMC